MSTAASSKTLEQIYQKKTQLEHILLRPDSYSECQVQAHPPHILFLTPSTALQLDLFKSPHATSGFSTAAGIKPKLSIRTSPM